MATDGKPKHPPRGAASPTSPRRLRAAGKQIQAMQLREAGVSYEKIAETCGYKNRSSAFKAVQAGLKATRAEAGKSLRRLELRRLDRLWMGLYSRATGNPPDLAAVDRCLKIMHRRAALLGLDIEKLALTNPTGEKEFSGGLTDAQRLAGFRALADEFQRAQSAAGSDAEGAAPSVMGSAAGPADVGVPLPG